MEMANLMGLIIRGGVVFSYLHVFCCVLCVRHACNQFVKNTMCLISRSVYGTLCDAFCVK